MVYIPFSKYSCGIQLVEKISGPVAAYGSSSNGGIGSSSSSVNGGGGGGEAEMENKTYLSCFMRKPAFGISDQVRHKPGCTAR